MLDAQRPCDLLNDEQTAELRHGSAATPPTQRRNDTFDVPTCTYSGPGVHFTVTAVTTAGLENGARRTAPTQTLPTQPIAGFPAVVIKPAAPSQRCSVGVDVADEEHLLIEFELDPDRTTTSLDPCERARKVAEAAMANIT